jgi:hypothetical protein
MLGLTQSRILLEMKPIGAEKQRQTKVKRKGKKGRAIKKQNRRRVAIKKLKHRNGEYKERKN